MVDLDNDPRFKADEKYQSAATYPGRLPIQLKIQAVGAAEFTNERDGHEVTDVKLTIKVIGAEKELVVNWTNQKALRKAWGGNTDDWQGRKFILDVKENDGGFPPGYTMQPVPDGEDDASAPPF